MFRPGCEHILAPDYPPFEESGTLLPVESSRFSSILCSSASIVAAESESCFERVHSWLPRNCFVFNIGLEIFWFLVLDF